MATVEQQFHRANARHQAGDLAEAEALCRRLLQRAPRHAEALHLLGSVRAERGDPQGALPLFQRALARDARQARYHEGLGAALTALGRHAEAEAARRQARALEPVPAALSDGAALKGRIARVLAGQAGAEDAAGPPLISVLMCTYDRLDLLPRVLQSYAQQTLPPDQFEVVLVDDASTDGTAEFIHGYRPPYALTYHRQAENRGIGAARKQTVALARGEITLFADDDETARPDYLEQHLRTHHDHPQEDYGAHGRIELAPEVADSVTMRMLTSGPGLYHHFDDIPDGYVLRGSGFWTNVVSVKRSFLLRHGPFDDSTRAQEDVELGWRLGKSGLALVHNKRAVMDTLRRLTYAQFCRRQERIGAATAWLTRKHGDSVVPYVVGMANAEANLAALKPDYDRAEGLEEQVAVLEAAGWQKVSQIPGFVTHTLPNLILLCRVRFNYTSLAAYLRQMREYHAWEDDNPVTPAADALVSVILTGGAGAADRAAEGLRAQTYPHWELVVADGDDAEARQRAVAEAGGPYLVFLGDGDQLLPAFLAECVALLERTPSLSFAYGDWEQVTDAGDVEVARVRDYRVTGELEGLELPARPCALFRRRLWEDAGGWPAQGGSWDFWLAAAARGHGGRRIPKPLARCRRADAGGDAPQGVMDRARMVRRHPAVFGPASQASASAALAAGADAEADLEAARAEALFQAGDPDGAARLLERLDRRRPGRPRVLNGLGVVAWAAGRRGLALRHFRDALDADPDNADARANCEAAMRAAPADAPPVDPAAPLISVLMCTYDRLDLLPRVLQSYAQQTLPPDQFEVVLMDDASTDGTAEFLANYRAPFPLRLHRQETNQGLGVCRNRALALARGEIVLLVDDDETARPDYLEQHLRTHRQYPAEQVSVCGRVELGAEAARSVTMHLLTDTPGLYHHFDDLEGGRPLDFRRFWGNVISAKRRFLVAHGGFDAETRAQEDVELGWRLHPHGLVVMHNPDAILDTLRVLSLDQFLARQERIGEATAWLARKHPHPSVLHWTDFTDAETRLPMLERSCREAPSCAEGLAVLERAGWEAVSGRPGFRERTFKNLTDACVLHSCHRRLRGYVRRLRELQAQDAAGARAPAATATVGVIVEGTGGARRLAPLFGALLSQTYPHWELLVATDPADAEAQDTVRALAAAHPEGRIRAVAARSGESRPLARNRAAAASADAYLLRLGDREYPHPDFLAECVSLLERAPELSLAYADVQEGDRVVPATDYRLVQRPDQPGLPPDTGVVFRREAWAEAGGWSDAPDADWEFWRACGERGRLGRRVPRPLLGRGRPPEAPELAAEAARAEALFQAGDRDGAARLLRDLDRRCPGQPRVLSGLGAVAWAGGRHGQALRHFRDALDADPQDRTALLNCADALQALGRPGDAASLLGEDDTAERARAA